LRIRYGVLIKGEKAEKEKEKGIKPLVGRGGGGELAQPSAERVRARVRRPKAGDGTGVRGQRRRRGAHTPERAEGGENGVSG
jgi:hypothetical protein